MSKYVGLIEEAIDGLQKYIVVEEELLSLCRKTLSQNEEKHKNYMDAVKDIKARDDIESTYEEWQKSKAKAEVAFDVLSILGYKVDHYFMNTPVIIAWEG